MSYVAVAIFLYFSPTGKPITFLSFGVSQYESLVECRSSAGALVNEALERFPALAAAHLSCERRYAA